MPEMHYYGGSVASDPREKANGWLTAFDAASDRSGGNTPCPLHSSSGGVLITGDLNNDFPVLDAKTSEVLCRFNTGGSFGAGIVTRTIRSNMWRRPRVRFRPSLEGRDCRQLSSSHFPRRRA
jgi:outer membrane protein assembly factor BamB